MVRMGTRPAIERAGTETPHLQRSAPDFYPNAPSSCHTEAWPGLVRPSNLIERCTRAVTLDVSTRITTICIVDGFGKIVRIRTDFLDSKPAPAYRARLGYIWLWVFCASVALDS